MTIKGRKRIERTIRIMEELLEEIQAFQEEEHDVYVNMPEWLRSCERGEAMYKTVNKLEDAAFNLEKAIEYMADAAKLWSR